jgi:hypothetical protein
LQLNSNPADNPICYLHPRRRLLSAWVQHVPFAMYLVDALRPAVIVELGTRNGVSYCAFCQAVQHLGIDSRCTAVDSWQGDPHTGAYGPRVLADLRLHHDPLYGRFSRLSQNTFDEAAARFADRSIDLLHIDGFHTYEAASHDFEHWLPKLSDHGVVLLHDIAERGRGFGVWRLWSEISARYPSFAFEHGHGLGVVGVGNAVPAPVRDFLHLSDPDAARLRKFFLMQGRRVAFRITLDLAARLPARGAAAAAELVRRLSMGSASGG